MTEEKLKLEAKSYAQSKFDDKEQEYLHCIIAQTYYDGAEPREKRIAELEETNKKISDECHKLVDSLETKQNEVAKLKARIEKQNADILALKGLSERQKLQIEALDGQTPWKDIKDKSEIIKENAELKERADKADLDSVTFFNQLCKAKKLLKQFLEAKNGEDTYKAEWEAEQFLDEISE